MQPPIRWPRVLLQILVIAALVAAGGLPTGSAHAANGGPAPCVDDDAFRFVVTIANISDHSDTPTAFAPGLWALADNPGVLFVPGPHPGLLYWNADPIKTPGLENLAEDGEPSVLADTLARHWVAHGVFDRPAGAGSPGLLLPGGWYAFAVDARYWPRKLSFAFMLAESNDWFVATDVDGIALENAWGGPIASGDITHQLRLWDAGTEEDEPLGEGRFQAPRQSAPGAGPLDDDNTVRRVGGQGAPDIADLVQVEIRREYPTVFDATVRNVSGASGAAAAFSPGVYVAHTDPAITYMEGHPQLFKAGRANLGNGLEALAEDGNPGPVHGYISTAGWMSEIPVDGSYGIFDTPVNSSGPGSLRPGEEFHFTFEATPYAPYLSLATMLVQSNDWFAATPSTGVALFDADRNPVSGTIPVHIFDAGTEADEPLGLGVHQAPRQARPNSGPADDDNTVRRVPELDAADFITVTVVPRTPRKFKVEVSNVSGSQAVAPGIVLLHGACEPLSGAGLAGLAGESGAAGVAVELARQGLTVHVLDTPADSGSPGPLLPGATYETTLQAVPAAPNLSLAFMLSDSNAVVVGTPAGGIPLWDQRGNVVSGDMAAALSLLEVGTDPTTPRGRGDDHPPTRTGPESGQRESDAEVPVDEASGQHRTASHVVSVVVTPLDPE